jgi:hypothetical protein
MHSGSLCQNKSYVLCLFFFVVVKVERGHSLRRKGFRVFLSFPFFHLSLKLGFA